MAAQTTSSGEALRTLRNVAGLTLEAVASGADTSVSYLSKVERNQLSPTQEYVAKVAQFVASSMLARVA